MLLISTFCITINLSARAYAARNSFSLDSLKFTNAIYHGRLDWALPRMYLVMLLLFLVLSLFLAALWAGAITPVLSTKRSTEWLALPSFTDMTRLTDDNIDNTTYTQRTPQGTFTYTPEFDLQGLILNAAQGASSQYGAPKSHAKLDNTGYVYLGRSHGVGASVGLMDHFVRSTQRVPSYTYNERGYIAEPSCIYNDTSDWQLVALPHEDDWSLWVFNAMGRLPNGISPIFAVTSLGRAGALAMGAGTNKDDLSPSLYVAFASSNSSNATYGQLGNVQCQIVYNPTEFSIAVNTTSRAISVRPLRPAAPLINGVNVTNNVATVINNLGVTLAATVYISVIGETFVHNIADVEAVLGDNNASTLRGVADSLSSIIDSTLEAYSAAQLMILNDSTLTNVEVQYVAVVFGSSGYIYSILAIALAICVIYLSELVRTHGWQQLSRFNFIDIKSAVIGASMGGKAIANEAQSLHRARASAWHAAEDDPLVGQIRIRVGKSSEGGVAVLLAKQEDSVSLQPALGDDQQSGDEKPSTRPLRGCVI